MSDDTSQTTPDLSSTHFVAQELIFAWAKEREKGEPSGEWVLARLQEALQRGADVQGLLVCLADEASLHLRRAAWANGRTVDEEVAEQYEMGSLARLGAELEDASDGSPDEGENPER